jgi:hypothetical protein
MRYADILLMYAEAVNELNGPTNAVKYLQQVRERSFGGDARLDLVEAKHPDYATNKEDFLKAIIDERAFEFCGENVRKWDLMRWGILKDKMDEAKQNLLDLLEFKNSYVDVPPTAYWRNRLDDADPDNNEIIQIYGLNRGETEAKEKANGWTKKNEWIRGYPEATAADKIEEARYLKILSDALYKRDPNERQLLPIMSVILSGSQGSLYNDYDY